MKVHLNAKQSDRVFKPEDVKPAMKADDGSKIPHFKRDFGVQTRTDLQEMNRDLLDTTVEELAARIEGDIEATENES